MRADVDWRTKGVVTPVKNQGSSCNFSLAFATTGLVEGATTIAGSPLHSLSEQQLVDCTASCGGAATGACAGTGGCAQVGCLVGYLASHGACSEASYPYTDRIGSCKSCAPAVAPVPDWGRVPPGDESALVSALNAGPVLARLEVGQHGTTEPAYLDYRAGVLVPPATDDSVVQWVLVVGYTSQYFIVKNSLGTSWGSSGYLFLARGSDALGIANFAYTLQAPGPATSGACHAPSGACQELDATGCQATGGSFAGVGTFCPTPCAGAVALAVPGLSRGGMLALGLLLYVAGAALLLRTRLLG